jgi:hypothetical protein
VSCDKESNLLSLSSECSGKRKRGGGGIIGVAEEEDDDELEDMGNGMMRGFNFMCILHP